MDWKGLVVVVVDVSGEGRWVKSGLMRRET